MKKVKTTREYERYEEACAICGKIILGTSEGQVRFNIQTHQKGKDCIEINEEEINEQQETEEIIEEKIKNETKQMQQMPRRSDFVV